MDAVIFGKSAFNGDSSGYPYLFFDCGFKSD